MKNTNQSILFKNYIVPLNYNLVSYIEFNNYYSYTLSSLRKFKGTNYFNVFLNDNEIKINYSLFYLNSNKYTNDYFKYNNNIFEYNLLKHFKKSFYENKGKLKIIGRGWKIVKYSYQLLIKLGYSHMIFLNMNPIFKYKLKKKKKKYYLFYGTSYNDLNSLLNKIRLMRIPDIYTRKGIFHRRISL